MFGRRGEKQDQAFTRIPDQVSLFSISSKKKKKNTAYTHGRAKTKYTINVWPFQLPS